LDRSSLKFIYTIPSKGSAKTTHGHMHTRTPWTWTDLAPGHAQSDQGNICTSVAQPLSRHGMATHSSPPRALYITCIIIAYIHADILYYASM
jgi:hypothetical protein